MSFITDFFRRKKVIEAEFIDKTGRSLTKKVKYTNDSFTVNYFGKEEEYNIDYNKMIYDMKTNQPKLKYFVGDPIPLTIENSRNPDMNASGYKAILNSKVVEDLFKEKKTDIMLIIAIMVGVSIVLSFVIIGKVFNLIK